MFDENEKACCCGSEKDETHENCDCGCGSEKDEAHEDCDCCCGSEKDEAHEDCDCGCGSEKDEAHEDCDCGCGCDSECGCGEEGHDHGEGLITMTDTETGEEYTFMIADDFAFEDEHYCVLVTAEEKQEPEMVIARVVTMEDGTEGLMSLDDAEYDRVYAEYERLCEEETDEDEDDGEEG